VHAQLLALPEEQQLPVLQEYMAAAAAEAVGIAELDPERPLLELGLDSLRAAEFAVQVPAASLFFSRPLVASATLALGWEARRHVLRKPSETSNEAHRDLHVPNKFPS
jgi:aryl carrier-like protein